MLTITRDQLVTIRTTIDEHHLQMTPRHLLDLISQLHPLLPQEMLFSIVSQRLRAQCAHNGRRVNIDTVQAGLYAEFNSRSSSSAAATTTGEKKRRREAVIPALAREKGFYPWMTFRAVLHEWIREKHGKVTKKMMSSMTRSPHLIKNVQLQLEAVHCALQDELQGLVTDQLRSLVGRDHELALAEELRRHNVAFIDEEAQRRAGQDVTPDFRLPVPIQVAGRPVCWIDSKALFGDWETHEGYLNTQLLSYWNRFGPGLVIYWMGHECGIEQLASEVQVATAMPLFEHFNP